MTHRQGRPLRRRLSARWLAALACSAVLLAGCSSGPEKPKPTPLEELAPKIAGKVVWSQRVGGVNPTTLLAVNADVVTLGLKDGSVVALESETGRELWRADAGARLSAAAGSDGRFASVVTENNEVVTFDQGKVVWRARLGSKVVTPPLVAGERVFVQGVDRAAVAFDALDGRKLWVQQPQGDPLTLAQPSVLMPFKDTLLSGQGAKLAGLDPLLGTVRFEVTVASPRGTNEVERLADLVGPAGRAGDVVCARAFQASVGCVNAERGSLVWSKTIGGFQGIAADDQYVFAADASDRITAWRIVNGDVAWSSEKFMHRGLSAPLSAGRTVVFGDAEGYVHFLSREDGQPLLRIQTDGEAIIGAPVRSGSTIIVLTAGGSVFAFRPE
jgi:outer membrane protein assembly factor BamB